MPSKTEQTENVRAAAPSAGSRWRFTAAALGAVTMVCALTACSVPNLSMSSSGHKAKTTTTASSTTSQPTPAKAAPTTAPGSKAPTVQASKSVPRPAGVLDTGSVTHRVSVGAFWAVIVYYTDDDAKLYRGASTKTIRVAVHLEGIGRTDAILVNNFVATADDGITRAVVKHDGRSFAITPPQSYNSVVTIPATTDQSTAVTLVVELDLSVQIAPTVKLYSAQTALDHITLPLLTGSQT
jgi:hypothetical protein